MGDSSGAIQDDNLPRGGLWRAQSALVGKARARGLHAGGREVVAGTCVLALALASSILVLQIGFRDVDVARTSTAVSQAVQSEVERLRAMNWEGILALAESETVDVTESHSTEAIAGGRLVITRTVADVPDFENMKEIRITGAWTSINGTRHTRNFIMRYGKGGLYDYYYGGVE